MVESQRLDFQALNYCYENFQHHHHESGRLVASTKLAEADQHQVKPEVSVIARVTMIFDLDHLEYFAESRMRLVHFGAFFVSIKFLK